VIDIAAGTDADLDAIVAIERQSFPVPWSEAAFRAEIERPWARLDVARFAGQIAAYCNYWLVPDEIHIHSIATLPSLQRRGIAAALLDHVLQQAGRAGCGRALLEVRASNAGALRLYERAGFATLHIRPRYYGDNDEDAVVMTRRL